MHEINGTTRVCFVVADPVAQLRTPQAQNRLWAERDLDIVTVPAHVSEAGLADFVRGLRANVSALGAVVTVPHKQTAVALCDELGPAARIAGAVNAIRRMPDGRLVGETFDGRGFVAGLRAEGIEPAGMRCVVIGAGGAASAIAVALLDAGVTRLDIVNRTSARADELVGRLRDVYPDADIAAGLTRVADADLVVNGTSVGMAPGDESPLEPGLLPPSAIAADVIMSAEATPFLAMASAAGNRTHDGRHMLGGQLEPISQFLVE